MWNLTNIGQIFTFSCLPSCLVVALLFIAQVCLSHLKCDPRRCESGLSWWRLVIVPNGNAYQLTWTDMNWAEEGPPSVQLPLLSFCQVKLKATTRNTGKNKQTSVRMLWKETSKSEEPTTVTWTHHVVFDRICTWFYFYFRWLWINKTQQIVFLNIFITPLNCFAMQSFTAEVSAFCLTYNIVQK